MTPEQLDNPIAQVDFEDARKLADLVAITRDLGDVMNTCTRLKELLKDNSKDHLLIESLWTAALVKYASCFTNSKRFGLSELIFHELQGDPIGVHQFYINLRNKHVAHSVNPFEQMEVGAILSRPGTEEKKVIGVATLAMRHICSDLEGVHQLGCLSNVLMEKVRALAKECEGKVLNQMRQIPIEDLYKRARLQLTAPGPESAGKPRK